MLDLPTTFEKIYWFSLHSCSAIEFQTASDYAKYTSQYINYKFIQKQPLHSEISTIYY
jgi:hypothetical protein